MYRWGLLSHERGNIEGTLTEMGINRKNGMGMGGNGKQPQLQCQ